MFDCPQPPLPITAVSAKDPPRAGAEPPASGCGSRLAALGGSRRPALPPVGWESDGAPVFRARRGVAFGRRAHSGNAAASRCAPVAILGRRAAEMKPHYPSAPGEGPAAGGPGGATTHRIARGISCQRDQPDERRIRGRAARVLSTDRSGASLCPRSAWRPTRRCGSRSTFRSRARVFCRDCSGFRQWRPHRLRHRRAER